ncbi:MAG TPA: cell division protein FtsQ, partial [Desulfovibrio sp.]|nr:cell division protein FtsQ [Desulfovibrio sp.]
MSRGKKGAKNAYSRKSVKPQKATLHPGNGVMPLVKWIFTMLVLVSVLAGISVGLL